MKLIFLSLRNKNKDWAEEAISLYQKKISAMVNFEAKLVKPKSLDRVQAERKRKLECESLLQQIEKGDRVILLDEAGKSVSGSEDFSKFLVKELEFGAQRVVFVVCGAFGASDELVERADKILSLSPLTFNHLLAQVVTLEQIYRGLCIWKGIPYHNV